MKLTGAIFLGFVLVTGSAGAQRADEPLPERFGPAETPAVPGAAPAAPANEPAPTGESAPGSASPSERLLPFPAMTPTPPGAAGAGGGMAEAYGAFQRGYYLSAQQIAEPLANLGDRDAQTLLGEIYLRGLGVPRDIEEAARWYGVAAEAGNAEAQFRYAMMLLEGSGVAADRAKARDFMQRAADGGNAFAAFNYGQMLIEESPTGGFETAIDYFRRAAEDGLPDGQYALAQLYGFGRGMAAPDEAEARRWLREAAVKGHETAQIELGIWLINGRGGAVDAPGGFRWLKGAAERGNPIALNRVAHLYKDGVGTGRDPGEAAKWVVLARRARNADAELDGFFRALAPDEQQRALEAANRFRAS